MIENDIENITTILQAVICAGVTFRIMAILRKARFEEDDMKVGFLKAGKVLKAGIAAICISQIATIVNNIFKAVNDENSFGNATIKLLNQGSKAFVMLEVVTVVVLEIITFIKWQVEEDSTMKARHFKKIIEIVVVGGIIIGLSGLTAVITGYYS